MLPSALIRLAESSSCQYLVCVLALAVLFLLTAKYLFRSGTSAVECWFCSSHISVARGREQGFVCSVCEQYNGFTPDGAYNKIIPEQHAPNNSRLRYSAAPRIFESRSDVLCDLCIVKQSALVQKIAAFEPKCEYRWDAELKEYRAYLEQLYPLCESCRTKSRAVIADIDKKLLPSFLSWWTRVRCHISMEPGSSSSPRIGSTRAADCTIPRPLYLLARVCSALCLLTLLTGPTVSAFTQRHCLAAVHQKHSIWIKLLFACNINRFRTTHVLPRCSALIEYSEALTVAPVAEFWFSLLFFLLQIIFIALRCMEYLTKKPTHATVPNPIWFLVDILMLVLAGDLLVSTILAITPRSDTSNDRKASWFHVLFVIGVVFVPLVVSVAVGLVRWLLFCSADWQSQKRVLKESWPRSFTASESQAPESEFSKHPIETARLSPPSSCYDSSTANPSTLHGSPRPRSELPSLGKVSPKSLFRPPVLGWPPISARGTPSQYSGVPCAGHRPYTEPVRSKMSSLHFESDQSDANFLSSASAIDPDRFRPRSDGSLISRTRRHKKRRRRSGLVRFLLSLLFGPVETFRDVLSELVCLMNAVLIGLVIFGTARLFMRLLEIY